MGSLKNMKYIIIILLIVSFSIAKPVEATNNIQTNRDKIILELINNLMELVKKLQEQLQIELQKENKQIMFGSTSVVPLKVTVDGKPDDWNRYVLGGNCERILFKVNKLTEVSNSESKLITITSDKYFFQPQSTSTKVNLVFKSGEEQIEYSLDIGEALDRSETTGVKFDKYLGKCDQ